MTEKASKKTLIIEPLSDGHRFIYLNWVTERIAAEKDVLLITSSANKNHPILHQLQERFPELCIQFQPLISVRQKFMLREWDFWKWFRRAYKTACNDYEIESVFLPYFDYILRALPLAGSPFSRTPVSGIIMQQNFHHPEMGIRTPKQKLHRIDCWLFLQTLKNKNLVKLYTIDETLFDNLSDTQPKLAYLPDPAEPVIDVSQHKARQQLGLPLEKSLILVFGAVSMRKGLNSLINTVLDNKLDVTLVLAGKQTSDATRFLKQNSAQQLLQQKRLLCFNSFISHTDEDLFYRATDIVWCGYKGHFNMSGVVIKAALAERPLVSCQEGLIGYLTEKHQLGIACDCDDYNKTSEAIKHLLHETWLMDSERQQRFAKRHTIKNFHLQLDI